MDPRARRDDDDHDAIDLEHLEKMLRFLKEKKGRFVFPSTPLATTEEDGVDNEEDEEDSAMTTPKRKSAITGIPHTPRADLVFVAWSESMNDLNSKSVSKSRIQHSRRPQRKRKSRKLRE